jgi:hypothetical protein
LSQGPLIDPIQQWLSPLQRQLPSYFEARRIWGDDDIGRFKAVMERGRLFTSDERRAQCDELFLGWATEACAIWRDFKPPEPEAKAAARKLGGLLLEISEVLERLEEEQAKLSPEHTRAPRLDAVARLLCPRTWREPEREERHFCAVAAEGYRRAALLMEAIDAASIRLALQEPVEDSRRRKTCQQIAIYDLCRLCHYLSGRLPGYTNYEEAEEEGDSEIRFRSRRRGWFIDAAYTAFDPLWRDFYPGSSQVPRSGRNSLNKLLVRTAKKYRQDVDAGKTVIWLI